MSQPISRLFRIVLLVPFLFLVSDALSAGRTGWTGVLRDLEGKPVPDATVELGSVSGGKGYSVKTSQTGIFAFSGIVPGKYKLSVTTGSVTSRAANLITIAEDSQLPTGVMLLGQGKLTIMTAEHATDLQATGWE